MEMSDLEVQIWLDISWEDLGQDSEADKGASSSYPICFNLVWVFFFFFNEEYVLCHLNSSAAHILNSMEIKNINLELK